MWEYCLCSQLWLSSGSGVLWAAVLHPAAATNRKACPTMPGLSNGRVERTKLEFPACQVNPSDVRPTA
jgi:hypothetical protein